MVNYNKEIANDPNVQYFSWAGEIDVSTPLFLLGSHQISGYILLMYTKRPTFDLSRSFGPTDGLVNVDSATWGPDLGPGVPLGTIGGLDQ